MTRKLLYSARTMVPWQHWQAVLCWAALFQYRQLTSLSHVQPSLKVCSQHTNRTELNDVDPVTRRVRCGVIDTADAVAMRIETNLLTDRPSRVVSVLDSGAVGPGFKSQSRRCRVTVLGKLFTPIVPLFTKQQNW